MKEVETIMCESVRKNLIKAIENYSKNNRN